MPVTDHPNHSEKESRTSDKKAEEKIVQKIDQKEDNTKKKTTPRKVVLKPPNKDEKPTKKTRKLKVEVEQRTKITSMFKPVEKNIHHNNIPATSSADTRAKTNEESKDVQSNCSPVGDLMARSISPGTDVEHSRTLLVKTHPDLDNKMKSETYLVVPENNLILIPDPND